jgi:long-subunit acyl-CoA synthetase (AMP-forming)
LLAGHPVEDIRLRIVDDEIQVAGAHVNGGYLDPAHDAENKIREGDTVWHRTGDAGALGADGRLWLLGRIGSEVTLGGRRVFPSPSKSPRGAGPESGNARWSRSRARPAS